MSEPPADIFISHASEDKEDVARPLAEELRRRGFVVWYDEFVLRLGDNLRGVIDKGLSSSRFGLVILSHSFFSKEWPKRELDGFLARETAHGAKILLPVWHKITAEDVVRFSPLLAGKLAVNTDRGLDVVVQKILEVLESALVQNTSSAADSTGSDTSENMRTRVTGEVSLGIPDRPSLPKGLKLERQTVSPLRGSDLVETEFELTASEDLRGKAIRLFCDGSVYHAVGPERGIVPGTKVRRDDTHSVLISFDSAHPQPLTRVEGRVGSTYPLRVVRVEWVKVTTS